MRRETSDCIQPSRNLLHYLSCPSFPRPSKEKEVGISVKLEKALFKRERHYHRHDVVSRSEFHPFVSEITCDTSFQPPCVTTTAMPPFITSYSSILFAIYLSRGVQHSQPTSGGVKAIPNSTRYITR